jgi:PhnB protein
MNAMGSVLMASDFPPGQGEPQQAVSIMLAPATVAEGRRLFDALKAGGVVAEYGPTFFSKGFGMMKDQFGTHWIVGATEAPES